MSFSNSDLKNAYQRLAPLSGRTRMAFARALRGEMLDGTLRFMAALCFLIALAIMIVRASPPEIPPNVVGARMASAP